MQKPRWKRDLAAGTQLTLFKNQKVAFIVSNFWNDGWWHIQDENGFRLGAAIGHHNLKRCRQQASRINRRYIEGITKKTW